MAEPVDFSISGTSVLPYYSWLDTDTDPFDDGPAVRQAIEKATLRAIIRVVGSGGVFDQNALDAKLGTLSPNSGILARLSEFAYGNKGEVYKGKPTSDVITVIYKFTVKAAKLQEILVEEGVLKLPPSEEAPEEPTPEEAPEEPTPEEAPEEPTPEEAPEEPTPEEAPEEPTPEEAPEETLEDVEAEAAAYLEELEAQDRAEEDSNVVPSEDPSETKSETVIVGATHVVTTEVDALMVRSGPSTRDRILGRMTKGTKVRVVGELLGAECSWHKIEIVDPEAKDDRDGHNLADKLKNKDPLYSHGSYLKTLPGIPPSLLHTCEFKTDSNASSPDWRKLDANGYSCYYNKKTGEYETVVETKYQSEGDLAADGLTFGQLRKKVLVVGVKKLLYYYCKIGDEKVVETILGAFKGAYIPTGADGFFLDQRPDSFMRFVVVFPAKYFNALAEHQDPWWAPDQEEPVGEAHRTFHYALETLPDDIELVASAFESLNKQIKESGFEVVALDLDAEAKRLREVVSALREFLKLNEYPWEYKSKWTIEIGVTEDFKIDSILLYVDDKKVIPLCRGLVRPRSDASGLYAELYPGGFGLQQAEPLDSSRTVAYLWYLKKMLEEIEKKECIMPWTEFVMSFTYPVPKILPAQGKDPCDDKAPMTLVGGYAAAGEATGDDCSSADERESGLYIKTTSQVKNETNNFITAGCKQIEADRRKKSIDVVGDNIFADVDYMLARAGCSVDAIYEQILNKYGIDGLSKLAAGCTFPTMPSIPHFGPPKLPTINFPDFSFTWDPMMPLLPSFEFAIDLSMEFLCALIGQILQGITCGELAEAFGDFAVDIGPEVIKALLDKLGEDAPVETVIPFISAITSTLTPSEMANLLEGNASNEVKRQIKALARFKFPAFHNFNFFWLEDVKLSSGKLLSGSKINDFFRTLGDIIGPEAIEAARVGLPVTIDLCEMNVDPLLCGEEDIKNFEDDYSSLLDDRLNDGRGREQAEAARKRLQDLGKKLEDIIKDPDSALPENLRNLPGDHPSELADALGGLTPGCDDGLLPKNIPALDDMTNTVLAGILSAIRMPFNDETTDFLDSLITRETRALQPGDAGYTIADEADTYSENWTQARADQENYEKARLFSEVAPRLQKNLRSWGTYVAKEVNEGSNKSFQIDFLSEASQIEINSDQNANEALSDAGKKHDEAQNHLENLVRELAKLKETAAEIKEELGAVDQSTQEAINKLTAAKEALPEGANAKRKKIWKSEPHPEGSLSAARADYATARATLQEEAVAQKKEEEENPSVLQSYFLPPAPIVAYGIPYVSKPNDGFRDNFLLQLTTPEAAITKKQLDFKLVVEDKLPPHPVPAPPSESWAIGDSTSQAEAFASYILSRFRADGISEISHPSLNKDATKDPEAYFFYDKLRTLHSVIMTDLLRKVGKQTSNSPLFEVEALEDVELVPDPQMLPGGVCFPGEGHENIVDADLLDLYNITKEIKDEYDGSCPPIGQDDEETSEFEDAAKHGVVKLITRVYMLDILLRSIFAFSEFEMRALIGDNLIVEFINHNLKEDLKRLNPTFYKDVAEAAIEMIKKRVQEFGEETIENLYNVIDMDVLLNEKNPAYNTGEEALKFFAMEQLPDLVTKLEAKIGTNTYNIHRRFTDPPSNRDTDGESTPGGSVVMTPKEAGGWIRTIDVPRARTYGPAVGEARFQRARGVGGATDDSWLSQVSTQEIDLMYPDLRKDGGTFFLEKYIRIEDKNSVPDVSPNDPILKAIRNRPGGPENENPPDSEPHLSGVVNIGEWKTFITDLDNEVDGLEDVPTSRFFKTFSYGLRLVWLPKMKPGEYQITNMEKWVRADPAILESPLEGSAAILWSGAHATYRSFLDTVGIGQKFADTGGAGHAAVWAASDEDAPIALETNPLTTFEKDIFAVFDESVTEIVARKEKAYFLEESVLKNTTSKAADADLYGVNVAALETTRTVVRRPIHTFPLVSAEKSSKEGQLRASSLSINQSSDLEAYPDNLLSKLRKELITSPQYKYLFEYVFPLPRMLALITIYNSNSLVLLKPELNHAFDRTKETLRSLFYSLSPSKSTEDWWARQDETVRQVGGNAGLRQTQQKNIGTKGPSVNLLKLAQMTVPTMIRGMADMVDPHYRKVSKKVDAGWSRGKNWGAVPPLWPVNFIFGWGPPLTPIGMMAYSMPALPADKNKKKQNTKAIATGEGALDDQGCPQPDPNDQV